MSIKDDYLRIVGERQKLDLNVNGPNGLRSQVSEQQTNLSTLKEQLSDYTVNISAFNRMLSSFLGRSDLAIETFESDERILYRIVRGRERAERLSEGERSAIAFIFFILKLKEHGFNLAESIVVIDDPVSSLDSIFLFNAFSFLKEQVKDAKQVFVLTHSFTFLRLLVRWLGDRNDRIKKLNETRAFDQQRDLVAEFYLIENLVSGEGRSAILRKLDPLLYKFSTEYEYIYLLLKKAQAAGSNLADNYNIPNLARKTLESFLEFKFPGNFEFKTRLDKLEQIDPIMRDKIFQFVNFHSHGGTNRAETFDLTLLQETPAVLNQIFDLIEKVDKDHAHWMNRLVERAGM